MVGLRDIDHERVLELWVSGMTAPDIAVAMQTSTSVVRNCLDVLRKERGEGDVPYWKDVRKPEKRPKYVREHMCEEGELLTWAGAFKMLAHHMRRSGDADGWELACSIANAKGMRL